MSGNSSVPNAPCRPKRHVAAAASLQVGHLAYVPARMPLCSHLFGICHGGGGTVRSGPRRVEGIGASVPLPSVSKGRLRSGGETAGSARGRSSHFALYGSPPRRYLRNE